MCYNCGCGVPDDDMGKKDVADGGGSLTDKTFHHMAKIWGMDAKKAKEETYKLLKSEVDKKK